MSKEVSTKKDALPVVAGSYAQYAGRGLQNVTQEDISIPYINVLQDGSPQVKSSSPDRIKGAEAGMFYHTVTGEMYQRIRFVLAVTQHMFIEWVPRTEGGGFVGRHSLDSEVVRKAKAASSKFGKFKTDNGNDLVETYYMFGVLTDENGSDLGAAVIPFTSTKIAAYKKIMGRLNSFQLPELDANGNVIGRIKMPTFSVLLEMSTKLRTDEKGDAFVPVIVPAIDNDLQASLISADDPRFQLAAELESMVLSGRAKADESTQDGATASSDVEEDLPF